jgi:serine/threonine-protein kinase
VDENAGFSLNAIKSQQPIQSLGMAATGVGHLNQLPDVDGVVRHEALLVNYAGKAVPSVALLTAIKSLDLTPADIKLNAGKSLQIGKLNIKTDGVARMLPQFYKARDGKPAFAVDSFVDVLSGNIPASRYAGRIVVIGSTAAGVGTRFPVPGNPISSPAEAIAQVTSSILSEHFVVEPNWGNWAALGVLLLVAAYIVVALPLLPAGRAALFTLLLMAILLGAEFGLLSGAGLWFKLVFPTALLLIGYLALMTKRLLVTETVEAGPDTELAESRGPTGLTLPGREQLDIAFDRLQQAPVGGAVMDVVSSGKRPLTVGSMSPEAGSAADRPTLDRYQIERELGKGAMGVVYLGKDPKIGRVVAIKTMALSKEFEGQDLINARERFFREAETAGRLQHQNIVTIFDAGEENDLAYIAMEFLKGKDLVDFCKSGQLLPVRTVLSIVARVAEALAYAHRQHVVHRDIKPANVMFEIDSDTVKVTDFGIARITDSSKTKTGLVLGTPSFMSPEQLAGKKVDGRSDLYSLGVMLFQMLTGVLPFRAESMADLMYKIAKEPAPDIRLMRRELPDNLASMVSLSLGKLPQARYQDGDQFARELRAVLTRLKGEVPPVSAVFATASNESGRSDSSAMDIEI